MAGVHPAAVVMTVLDRTVLGGQLRGTLELMRVLQYAGERGGPSPATSA